MAKRVKTQNQVNPSGNAVLAGNQVAVIQPVMKQHTVTSVCPGRPRY